MLHDHALLPRIMCSRMAAVMLEAMLRMRERWPLAGKYIRLDGRSATSSPMGSNPAYSGYQQQALLPPPVRMSSSSFAATPAYSAPPILPTAQYPLGSTAPITSSYYSQEVIYGGQM